MRDNVIVNCPDDVGIYLNEALDVRIHNNTIYGTTGIDVRFEASVADLRNNILSGQIRERDGGTATGGSNLEGVSKGELAAWFLDPAGADFTLLDGGAFVDLGESLAEVPADYCANERDDGATDVGAVEYDGDGPCDTTLAGGVGTAGDAPCEHEFEIGLTEVEITGVESWTACHRITAGPGVAVLGEARFEAPRVALRNGVEVTAGGRLSVSGLP